MRPPDYQPPAEEAKPAETPRRRPSVAPLPPLEVPGSDDDIGWMQQALNLARQAAEAGEVPVGAVVVRNGERIAGRYNQPITLNDPSAHAEVLALRDAAQVLQNYRLPGATLYVTLEPCIMCAGLIIHARLARVVFGAADPKAGAVHSLYDVISQPQLNHRLTWTGGVLEAECSALLRDFFRARRR